MKDWTAVLLAVQRSGQFKKQKPSAIHTPSPGTYILGDDSSPACKHELTPKRNRIKRTSNLIDTDREDSDDDDNNNDSGFLEAQECASQATWQVSTDVELSEHQSVLDEGLAATQTRWSVNTRSAVSAQVCWPTEEELEGLSSGEIFDVEMAYLDKRLHDKEQTEDGALLMSEGAPGTTDLVEQPGRSEMDLVEGELGNVFLHFINGEAFSQGSTDEGVARGFRAPSSNTQMCT